ncbi:MAG: methyltransferase domain-containing protein [Acidobacteriota bacterium]
MTDKAKWEARYASAEKFLRSPSAFLRENRDLLPREGLALDLAAGAGRNSVFLAQRGLEVIALDISERALQRCLQLARDRSARVYAAVLDLKRFDIPANSFDCIVNFNYLQRDLAPQITEGLKEGGLLVFESLTLEHLRWKPDFNADFLLRPGEVKEMFRDLLLLRYREATIRYGQVWRSVASLAARKMK